MDGSRRGSHEVRPGTGHRHAQPTPGGPGGQSVNGWAKLK